MTATPQKTTRRHDLDFVRVVAFGLLIPYHASLIFGSKPFFIDIAKPNRFFDLFDLASHPWRMTVLFFLSGISTAFLARKMSPHSLWMERTRRLVAPLSVGMIFCGAPLAYVINRTSFDPDATFIQSWLAFFHLVWGDATHRRLVGGELYHMWFLLYLWTYVTIWIAIMAKFPVLVDRLRCGAARLMCGRYMLLAPIAFYAIARILLYPLFGEQLRFFSDGYLHAIHFPTFVLGYLVALDPRIWENIAASRSIALLLGLVALAVASLQYYGLPLRNPDDINMLVRAVLQWCAVIAIFGYAFTYVRRANAVITYLNKGVLTYYLTHQTVLVYTAYWLSECGLLNDMSYFLVVFVTVTVCALIYEAQRRFLVPASTFALRGLPR